MSGSADAEPPLRPSSLPTRPRKSCPLRAVHAPVSILIDRKYSFTLALQTLWLQSKASEKSAHAQFGGLREGVFGEDERRTCSLASRRQREGRLSSHACLGFFQTITLSWAENAERRGRVSSSIGKSHPGSADSRRVCAHHLISSEKA